MNSPSKFTIMARFEQESQNSQLMCLATKPHQFAPDRSFSRSSPPVALRKVEHSAVLHLILMFLDQICPTN